MRLKLISLLLLPVVMILVSCNGHDDISQKKTIESILGPETTYADGARRVTTDELDALLKEGLAVVIDVRDQASFDQGHIPGSRLIPAGEILKHVNELPGDKLIVTYCS
jgi:3-mercaptopyruvate sulfurtransferase SseA